jgi:transitional endoplasmic reticulum ATPase
MIEDGAHKEILKEDYERYRKLAEKHRERDELEQAADHYQKSADLAEQIAELESSEKLSEKRHSLATNLREAANKLDRVASTPAAPRDSDGDNDRTAETADFSSKGQPTSDGAAATDDESSPDPAAFLESPPELNFDDVGGMTDLKQNLIDKVVDPLERPELYEEYDLTVVNGVLLYGPPGTGKTYVTRALAGKLGYNFVEVKPADLTSSLVGEAADNVAELFAVARDNQPCLVFIDEIDAVAGQRSGGAQKTQSERQMVNQLLTELTETQGEDVVVVAATNMLESVDDAIKRSGRFDERIEVPPPDAAARRAILRVHLRDRPVLSDDIDWDRIAAATDGYVASDLELVATTAAREALSEARDRDTLQPVTQSHLETAIDATDSSLAN